MPVFDTYDCLVFDSGSGIQRFKIGSLKITTLNEKRIDKHIKFNIIQNTAILRTAQRNCCSYPRKYGLFEYPFR